LVTLFSAFFLTSAMGAIFYGKQNTAAIFTVAITSSAPALILTFTLAALFSRAKVGNLRQDLAAKKKQNKESSFFARLIDDDLAKAVEIPSYWRYVAFIIAFIVVVGSAFLMIVYGLHFDTDRQAMATSAKWTEYDGAQLLGGVILRQSLDPLPVCQQHCLLTPGCQGVVIRHSDGHCFEQSGSLDVSVTDPNLALYIFSDLTTSVTNKWIISLTIGVCIQMILDAVKVIIIVSLVYSCYGRKNLQRPSKVSSPAPMDAVHLEDLGPTNQDPALELGEARNPMASSDIIISSSPSSPTVHRTSEGQVHIARGPPGLEREDSLEETIGTL